jgi:transcription elongation factor GreB
MSRAFVKEESAESPPIIPPRAVLPAGTPNYVTPQGLSLLRAELSQLQGERAQAEANHSDEADRTRQLNIINGRLKALTERLSSAKVVAPRGGSADQVRFGATVTLQIRSGKQPARSQRFTIVGVDEASVAEGRVAFVAPIARALLGARLGQTVTLPMGRGGETAEVVAIAYPGTENRPGENAPE